MADCGFLWPPASLLFVCSHSGDSVSALPLQAGDDAGHVSWVDVDSATALYASHSGFLETAAKERRAHW